MTKLAGGIEVEAFVQQHYSHVWLLKIVIEYCYRISYCYRYATLIAGRLAHPFGLMTFPEVAPSLSLPGLERQGG